MSTRKWGSGEHGYGAFEWAPGDFLESGKRGTWGGACGSDMTPPLCNCYFSILTSVCIGATRRLRRQMAEQFPYHCPSCGASTDFYKINLDESVFMCSREEVRTPA